MQVDWPLISIAMSVSMETGDGAASLSVRGRYEKDPFGPDAHTGENVRPVCPVSVKDKRPTTTLVPIPPTEIKTIIVLRERSQWPRLIQSALHFASYEMFKRVLHM